MRGNVGLCTQEKNGKEKKKRNFLQSVSNSMDSLLTFGAVLVVSFDYNVGLKRH